MADQKQSNVLKEVVQNDDISGEEHGTYSDPEGLIKKLSLYNRFLPLFHWVLPLNGPPIHCWCDYICSVLSILLCSIHRAYWKQSSHRRTPSLTDSWSSTTLPQQLPRTAITWLVKAKRRCKLFREFHTCFTFPPDFNPGVHSLPYKTAMRSALDGTKFQVLQSQSRICPMHQRHQQNFIYLI